MSDFTQQQQQVNDIDTTINAINYNIPIINYSSYILSDKNDMNINEKISELKLIKEIIYKTYALVNQLKNQIAEALKNKSISDMERIKQYYQNIIYNINSIGNSHVFVQRAQTTASTIGTMNTEEQIDTRIAEDIKNDVNNTIKTMTNELKKYGKNELQHYQNADVFIGQIIGYLDSMKNIVDTHIELLEKQSRETANRGGKKKIKHKTMKKKRKKQKGGIKVEGFTITWKGKDRSVYTINTLRFRPPSSQDIFGSPQDIIDSQDSEGSQYPTIILDEFNEHVNKSEIVKKLNNVLKYNIRYIFVIVYKRNKQQKGEAKMHLCEYNPYINHNDLTKDDEAKENILAAGELIWVPENNKLKISNQSGHYEPEAEDVRNVTIDFFAKGIDIDFYYPFNSFDGSQTPLSSQSQSPNDAMSGNPDDQYKTTKKGGRKKSLKKKSKMKKIKRKTMKKKKSKKHKR